MIKELIKLANHLDNKGFTKEADYLDSIIKVSMDYYDSEDESSTEEEYKPLIVPVPNMRKKEEDFGYLGDDLSPITEEYDDNYFNHHKDGYFSGKRKFPEDEEYRINVRGPHTDELDVYDFFPEYPGSRDDLKKDLSDPKSSIYKQIVKEYFQERISGKTVNETKERRRRQGFI